MRIETREDFERARERLRGRDADTLAAFLMSLALEPGSVGEQVRTFIGGDDLTETVASLKRRIGGLTTPSDYDNRHSLGRDIGRSLDFIVDSIERLVLPVDATAAFQLLVTLFEADSVAMENCGEHDWDEACAYRQARDVMAKAARRVPRTEVEKAISALMQSDGYGLRAGLASVLSEDIR